jgi:hypothetical protein
MQRGRVIVSKWNSHDVECHQCGKELEASSLGRHLADVHDIYQQTVIAKELLEADPLYSIRSALSCTLATYRACIQGVRGSCRMDG